MRFNRIMPRDTFKDFYFAVICRGLCTPSAKRTKMRLRILLLNICVILFFNIGCAINTPPTKPYQPTEVVADKPAEIMLIINKFPINELTHNVTFSEIIYLDSTINNKDLFLIIMEWYKKCENIVKSDVLSSEDGKTITLSMNISITLYYQDRLFRIKKGNITLYEYNKKIRAIQEALRSSSSDVYINQEININNNEENKGISKGGFMDYDMLIHIRDGRYKYELTNFRHTNLQADNGFIQAGSLESFLNQSRYLDNETINYYYLSQVEKQVSFIIETLKNHINTSIVRDIEEW